MGVGGVGTGRKSGAYHQYCSFTHAFSSVISYVTYFHQLVSQAHIFIELPVNCHFTSFTLYAITLAQQLIGIHVYTTVAYNPPLRQYAFNQCYQYPKL